MLTAAVSSPPAGWCAVTPSCPAAPEDSTSCCDQTSAARTTLSRGLRAASSLPTCTPSPCWSRLSGGRAPSRPAPSRPVRRCPLLVPLTHGAPPHAARPPPAPGPSSKSRGKLPGAGKGAGSAALPWPGAGNRRRPRPGFLFRFPGRREPASSAPCAGQGPAPGPRSACPGASPAEALPASSGTHQSPMRIRRGSQQLLAHTWCKLCPNLCWGSREIEDNYVKHALV